jgi:IS30 family transposase
MIYGFVDEAGDVGSGPRSSQALVVAAVLTSAPQTLRREVKRFRTRLGKRNRQIPELKASRSESAWNRQRLRRLASLDIEVVAVITDKSSLPPRQEPEELYRRLCTRVAAECSQRFPSLALYFDKRYNNPHLRALLERSIRDGVGKPGRMLNIQQRDSHDEPAPQQADLVAWAFLQKHASRDDSFVVPLRDRVIVEIIL